MKDDGLGFVPKYDGAEFGSFRAARVRCLHELARSHGKKVGSDDEVDGMLVDIGAGLCGTSKLPQAPEEFWSGRLLPIGWRVYIVVGSQEGS